MFGVFHNVFYLMFHEKLLNLTNDILYVYWYEILEEIFSYINR